jgi:hypothetical protein
VRRIAGVVETGDNGQSSVVLDDGCNVSVYSSAPILRSVPDVQDFDNFFSGTVHNDIRRADKLAGSPHLSGAAKAREGCQVFNAVNNRLSDVPGSSGIVLLDAFHSGFKLIGRFGCPPNLSHE